VCLYTNNQISLGRMYTINGRITCKVLNDNVYIQAVLFKILKDYPADLKCGYEFKIKVLIRLLQL
jgi:hypothetical protein